MKREQKKKKLYAGAELADWFVPALAIWLIWC